MGFLLHAFLQRCDELITLLNDFVFDFEDALALPSLSLLQVTNFVLERVLLFGRGSLA